MGNKDSPHLSKKISAVCVFPKDSHSQIIPHYVISFGSSSPADSRPVGSGTATGLSG